VWLAPHKGYGMKSPFAIFRKHERVLMVVVTILAMVAFIAFDQITPAQVPVIFGTLAGAGLFWAVGAQTGRGWEYAVAGGVLGLAVGLVLPRWFGPEPAYRTTAGNLSDRELYEMMTQRQRVNQWAVQAMARSLEDSRSQQVPANPFGPPVEDEVVRIWLLNKEADDLGIHLSDDAVIEFIRQLTNSRLSQQDFIAIRNQVGWSESQLLDAIRYELRAQLAAELLLPDLYPTPDEYWEIYKRLNVTTEVALAELPVEAFVNEQAEPTQQELQELFEKYKAVLPNTLGPGTPGFYQPDHVQFASLEADFEQTKEKTPPPSEEEIREHYEQNKDLLYRQFPSGLGSSDPARPGDMEFFSGDDEPVEAPKPEPALPVLPPSDEPAEGNQPPAETSNQPQGEASNSGPTVDRLADAGTEPFPTFLISADAPEEKESSGPDDPPPAQPDAGEKSAAEPPTSRPQSSESPLPTVTPAPAGNQTPGPAKDPLPEYRPLEEVHDQIRENLHDEAVRKKLADKLEEAQSFMFQLGRQLKSGDKSMTPQKVSEQLKEYAQKNGLRYVASELVTFRELNDPDKYPISLATDPVSDPSQRQSAQSLPQHLFGTGADVLYNPFVVETALDQNRYAVWKIEHREGDVPDFDDVKDQVVRAWRLLEAQPEAEKRAQELAKSVGEDQGLSEAFEGKTVSGKPDGQPLNVQQTEPFSWLRRLSVSTQNPFDAPEATLSTISAVESAGEEFMRTVFEDLDVGETGVAPAADRSAYYVVQVKSRTPSDKAGMAKLRESFLREDLFARNSIFGPIPTTYEKAMGRIQERMYRQFFDRFAEKFAIQRSARSDEAAAAE
jgi:hypothetical protein